MLRFNVRTRLHPQVDFLFMFLLAPNSLFCVNMVNTFAAALMPYALYQAGFGFNVALPSVLASRMLINLRAWERWREQRVDVNELPLEQWETMFHITSS